MASAKDEKIKNAFGDDGLSLKETLVDIHNVLVAILKELEKPKV